MTNAQRKSCGKKASVQNRANRITIAMTRFNAIAFERLATRLLFVSLVCALLFVLERFIYNVFDVGWGVRRSYITWCTLHIFPFLGYWIVLLLSPLVGARGKAFRCVVLASVAFLLTYWNFKVSVWVFWNAAESSGVRYW